MQPVPIAVIVGSNKRIHRDVPPGSSFADADAIGMGAQQIDHARRKAFEIIGLMHNDVEPAFAAAAQKMAELLNALRLIEAVLRQGNIEHADVPHRSADHIMDGGERIGHRIEATMASGNGMG